MKTRPSSPHLDSICEKVTAGKRAAQEIMRIVSRFDLKEPEFRLLWCLTRRDAETNQSQLAQYLALSAAQVCALVEKLDRQGLIRRETAGTDRRRSLWKITERGVSLLQGIQRAVEPLVGTESSPTAKPRRISA